ncbi:NADH (or F420H2) dehydrogenase, subunit C [Cellulomonas flavigena DSM 20109]|uniref:NADH-quinone oxidoreductase subunit C n=1 Tax=Cellulomonas flavigena (strain ATCC 482 / DSM 20109 / BCRC 11376 / JCM 18109 / NBRC 3775 / NCIMB 8073 / NRS 134) TaxID=446466 RepID=D5UJ34_CELFN|nr:NADH-quinone oxidoreductase subunit C [Cellulomonas flavigena]ADG75600.1 NADH (or F420H2) dehydrogenase, subunit C [Cellulomonas flavigena DSM 20109]
MSDEKTTPPEGGPEKGTKPEAVGTPREDATTPGADRPVEGDKATAEKADASAAVKPGEPAPAGTQRTSAAALEAGSQNVPAGVEPGARTPLDVVDVRTGLFGVSGTGDTSGFGGLVRTIAMPGPSERPYGGWFDEVVDILTEVLDESGTGFANAVESVVVDRGELTLNVAREHLVEVVQQLRDDPDLRFELSLGVSGVHFPHDAGRELHAVYQIVSVTHGRRLRLEVAVPEGDPHVPSTTAVYPANDWHERETWDFFGIVFDGHPGLARIQMPDDWPGHPQRKDYPLGGIPVEYKGATIPPPDQRRSYS